MVLCGPDLSITVAVIVADSPSITSVQVAVRGADLPIAVAMMYTLS